MVTKKTASRKKVAAKKPTTAIASIRERLAEQAAAAQKAEQTESFGPRSFSLQAGQIALGDDVMPGNKILCIIADAMYENKYFDQPFVQGQTVPVTCFAFGFDQRDMEPHASVVEAGQAQSLNGCAACEHNQFGSRGKGKACANRRRLAVVPAGSVDARGNIVELWEDFEDEITADKIAFLSLPVMSVKNYATFVTDTAIHYQLPPWAVYAVISTQPNAKSQFEVVMEAHAAIPDALLEQAEALHGRAREIIQHPYSLTPWESDDTPPPAPARSHGKKKAARY